MLPPPAPVAQAYQISDQSERSTEPITSTLVSSKSSLSEASSSESESDSDSEGDDSDATTDSETTERLRDLFLKAKASAREKAACAGAATADSKGRTDAGAGDSLAGQDEVVFFGGDDSDDDDAEERAATPKASSSRSALPPSLVRPVHLKAPTAQSAFDGPANVSTKGKAKASAATGPISLAQDLAGAIEGGAIGDRWGQAPRPKLSKKERLSRNPRTAGPKWFNMPATELTPDVKREIQAMRLRNALDPKRFYKGGAKDDKKLPEFFSLGHVVASTASASTANPAAARKRTFVEELVDDEQARAYTKRKTSEVMARGMSGRSRQKRGGKAKDGRVPRA